MNKVNFIILILLVFIGCSNNKKQIKNNSNLNGKKLLIQKCSRCHNLAFPPKNFKDEKAPPVMTISFHFHDWMKGYNDESKMVKFISFAQDYVINPSKNKAYCPPDMLKHYGIMPSQKGKVTKEEIKAIAKYIWINYTFKKLSEKESKLKKFNSLPKGEQIALKYHCMTCHRKNKNIVGPSFKNIAKRYKNNINIIKTSIKKGSKAKWKNTKAIMPSFNNISNKDLNQISQWILNLNTQ